MVAQALLRVLSGVRSRSAGARSQERLRAWWKLEAAGKSPGSRRSSRRSPPEPRLGAIATLTASLWLLRTRRNDPANGGSRGAGFQQLPRRHRRRRSGGCASPAQCLCASPYPAAAESLVWGADRKCDPLICFALPARNVKQRGELQSHLSTQYCTLFRVLDVFPEPVHELGNDRQPGS